MSEAIKPLEEVRREIDEIDAALHDLIMRRTRVVEQVIAAKGTTNTGNFIPGREIKVLRGLMQRHEGAFPRHALIRMWREMISVFAAMQGPFHVVAGAEEGDQGCWDLARDHFGSHDKMSTLATPREVVARVSSDEAAIGVVPVPAEDGDAWWRTMGGAVAPRIVARLPFIEGSNARTGGVGAYALAKLDFDPTGDDRSLLVVETETELSRAGLRSLLTNAGLTPQLIVTDRRDGAAHLMEVDGFVQAEDEPVRKLADLEEVRSVLAIGAYGVPVQTSEAEA
ncbi:MAG: chorismate mutase [Rhodospirillaceae bacterium]|nr:chorismate mutase [Rhodospirillaceae bacterium]